jgi:hypothetical protein
MLWWQHALGTARLVWPWAARLAALVTFSLAFLSTACEHRTTLVDPDAPSDSVIDDDGGTVQKATLTVTVSVRGADSVWAAMLGSTGGVLRDAEVNIQRVRTGETYADTTDESGGVSFQRILPGRYAISVVRVLTAEELELIGAGGADLNAFAGAKSVEVEAPSSETVVMASAGSRGSLVISELHIGLARMSGGEWYYYAQFIELYNNSDTTIHLDGKILVKAILYNRDTPIWDPCDSLERWLNDPEGIWTGRNVEAFPGSGRDYPLAPGQATVVAMDAIDHRQYHPDLHDLSGADFELRGPEDVDNPAVPDMVTLGRVWGGGHGLQWGLLDEVVFVAEPVDVSSLRRDEPPRVGEHWLIPGSKILDVLACTPKPAIEAYIVAQGSPLCPRIVHQNFDQQPAAIVDAQSLEGIQRRVFAVLPDGRKVLQRTKTSSRDFVARYPATPGFIPD